MENLSPEQKKSIIIKIVVSIFLLILMIIIGLVLITGGNFTSKLKGEVANVSQKTAATCDDLISNNYGIVKFHFSSYDDDFYKMLPITLNFVDRKSGNSYKKLITLKDYNMNKGDVNIKILTGNYDITITKPGYLYSQYENETIKPNQITYLRITDMLQGDINGDGYINDLDLNAFLHYKNKTCGPLKEEEKNICNSIDFNNDGIIDENDESLFEKNLGNIYKWYKNGNSYTGEYIIDQEDFVLTYGQTKQLTYHTTDYFTKTTTPYWNSTNTRVVKVENGLVTPLSLGTAQIQIGDSEYINVSVVERGSIVLDDTDIIMDGIQTKQLNYTYSNDNTFGNFKPRWSSSNSSIVRVDENGIITSLKKGTATITATAGFNTTAKVKVTVNDVQAQDFEISETPLTFNGYEKKQINVKPLPSNATIYKYKYEVVDDTYASVTTDGLVTSKKSGSTKVKVTLVQDENEISHYVDVKINYVATESILYENMLNFDGSEIKNVKITYYPSNGLDRNIIATSNDVYDKTTNKILSSISTSDGNIKVVSSYPGSASINLTIDREQNEDLTGLINVNVIDVPITGITLQGGGNWELLEVNKILNMQIKPSNYTANHSRSLVGVISTATSSNTKYANVLWHDDYSVHVIHGSSTKGTANICIKTTTGYQACTSIYRN